MAPRYHDGKPVKTCPVCGKYMELGSRVKVQLSWEMDDRYKLASAGGYVCRRCAEQAAKQSALEVPDQMWPYL